MRRPLAILLISLVTIASSGAGKARRPVPPKPDATIEEIKGWVAREYPRVVFNPEGIPAEVWASFFTDFAELAPDLPNTVGNLAYIGTKGADWTAENLTQAMMLTTGNPGGPYALAVNPKFCASLKDMKASCERDEAKGYHPRGITRKRPTYPLVAHELAHLLEAQMEASDRTRHAKWMKVVADNEASKVSKYAETNPREAFAEAVAAWHVQDEDEFAPLTRLIGAELQAVGIAR